MLTLIYFVLILGVIVLVHEFGHFIFSKLFGVYVHEFSIGMGPAIFQRQGKNKDDARATKIILSKRSKIPPCPGIKFEKSFLL